MELESALAMWLARQLALTAITPTIRTLARPTATMALTISSVESSSAQAPGITAGDIHIMDGPTRARLQDLAALRDVVLQDVVMRGVALPDVVMRDMLQQGTS